MTDLCIATSWCAVVVVVLLTREQEGAVKIRCNNLRRLRDMTPEERAVAIKRRGRGQRNQYGGRLMRQPREHQPTVLAPLWPMAQLAEFSCADYEIEIIFQDGSAPNWYKNQSPEERLEGERIRQVSVCAAVSHASVLHALLQVLTSIHAICLTRCIWRVIHR